MIFGVSACKVRQQFHQRGEGHEPMVIFEKKSARELYRSVAHLAAGLSGLKMRLQAVVAELEIVSFDSSRGVYQLIEDVLKLNIFLGLAFLKKNGEAALGRNDGELFIFRRARHQETQRDGNRYSCDPELPLQQRLFIPAHKWSVHLRV